MNWAEHAMPNLFAAGARFSSPMKRADRHRPIANLVVSSVPVRTSPYLGGAELQAGFLWALQTQIRLEQRKPIRCALGRRCHGLVQSVDQLLGDLVEEPAALVLVDLVQGATASGV